MKFELFRSVAALAGLPILLLANLQGAAAEDEKYLKAFPAAREAMKRFVIQLPHKERDQEQQFRVELQVGRVMETDGVNRVMLGGEIIDKPLVGWGFTFYEVEKFGPAASTRMGVPPGTKPKRQFVYIAPRMIGYNSRIPIVVYVPDGAKVRYRIFEAPKTYTPAAEQ